MNTIRYLPRTWSILFLVIIVAHGITAAETKGPLAVKSGNTTEYLIEFDLKPYNCELEVPGYNPKLANGKKGDWKFREGGQFSLFIKREYFPVQIPASCCDSYLVLTMPYTNPRLKGGEQNIAAKKKLFDAITQLRKTEDGQIRIVIDLTPYAEVVKKIPLELRLTDRQIYFRQIDGLFANHTRATKRP